jgi:hypothetical protein|tara:strand:+ start:285 stop:488 length:204 start_codon:yes stop_codon:yes gene_type:complete
MAAAKNFIIVLSDGETYDLTGTIVRVTDEQLEEIEAGQKVYNAVDLCDSSVCCDLDSETLSKLLPSG